MNVFIVEDSEIVSDELKAMLSEIPGIKLVGHAVDERSAIEQIGATLTDVVVLDIALRTGSGINVLHVIKKRNPAIKVVMLTNYTDACYVSRCIGSGADYFYDKSLEFMKVGTLLKKLVASDELEGKQIGSGANAHG
jgi:DNA-binding NarL/FixJ family response regulator